MKKLLLTISFLLNLGICYATQITYGTIYGPISTVNSVNLNGNFSNAATVVNGNLDNTNANTTAGFRFYETLAALPTTGLTQGRAVFLTADNTWNIYTGSAWIKTLNTTLTSPSTGQVIAYDGANWINSNALSSVSDYGTSLSASTARQATSLKVAYGVTPSAIGTSSCVTVSNLPFTSTTSFVCTVGQGALTTTTSWTGPLTVGNVSASSMNICNSDASRTTKAMWSCMGT